MRKGLTIGELLVAMAIIGVIAALVVPGFLKDYHKKLYTTQLKKSYEMIFTAVEQACTDNSVSAFSLTGYASANNPTKWKEFLNKYFKVVDDAGTSSTDIFNTQYRTMTNTNTYQALSSTGIESSAAKARLKSGEAIAMYCKTLNNSDVKNVCYITLDINSVADPNIGGRDMFRFSIDADNNQVYGATDYTNCQPDAATPKADAGGHGCLDRIIRNNWVMDY